MDVNCGAMFAVGSWSEPTHGLVNSDACWSGMSICSPLTAPSSISLVSRLLLDYFEALFMKYALVEQDVSCDAKPECRRICFPSTRLALPDDLIAKLFWPENGIHQHLQVVACGRIAVQVNRAITFSTRFSSRRRGAIMAR